MATEGALRIACVADQHGQLPVLPACDWLIVAGDMTDMRDTAEHQAAWLRGPFSDWLRSSGARLIIGVSGNHEHVKAEMLRTLPWRYLHDETAVLEGLLVHGLAWQSRFVDQMHADMAGAALAPRFTDIPSGLDLLVTHDAPYGIGDVVRESGYVKNAGSHDLRRAVELAAPRVHVFGHIHGDRGEWTQGATRFVNADSSRDGVVTVIEIGAAARG